MPGNSKENLLDLMAEKSITLGWDAIVTYQREAMNDILEQQFVQNLADGNFFYHRRRRHSGKSLGIRQ